MAAMADENFRAIGEGSIETGFGNRGLIELNALFLKFLSSYVFSDILTQRYLFWPLGRRGLGSKKRPCVLALIFHLGMGSQYLDRIWDNCMELLGNPQPAPVLPFPNPLTSATSPLWLH